MRTIPVLLALLLALPLAGGCGGASAAAVGGLATPLPPGILLLSHEVAPIGSTFRVAGSSFFGLLGVAIGGVAQPDFVVRNDGILDIGPVDPATPLGTQPLVLVGPGGSSAPFPIEVIALTMSPAVFAHGSTPRIDQVGFGVGFAPGDLAVRLGGIASAIGLANGSTITLAPVSDALPIGWTTLEIESGDTFVAPVPVPVVHLVISEVDCDTPSVDAQEFVELWCGVGSLDLAGYILVFFNGGAANDTSYHALDLAVVVGNELTNPGGFLTAGNAAVVPPPRAAHQWPNNLLQNGADAVAIFQGTLAEFPVGTLPTTLRLIDAVVYDTDDADDAALLSTLLGVGPQAVQVDEDANNDKDTESIRRIGPARLDGRAFAAGPPTPWAPN
jgi:hypothetical protein